MIDKILADEVLLKAVSGGADFAEIFCELTRTNVVSLVDKKIDKINDNVISGVGIRAFYGTQTVYASTCDTSREGLLACAAKVADVISLDKKISSVNLTEKIFANIHPVAVDPIASGMGYKTDILKNACRSAESYDSLIEQAQGNLSCIERNIWIANTEGLFTFDKHTRTRMYITAIAAQNGEKQTGMCAPGRGMGLEVFDIFKPEDIGAEAARHALVNLRADYCPAGKMTVAIENGFGGVIFHEACGHSLEATCVGIGNSKMCGKLGQKIANEKVTAIDDGTIPGGWGSNNIDDEGNPTQKNILIEKGILKNYMIDRLGSRRMNMPVTGNSRRQNYTFEPTSRMTNTYIDNGPDKNEDIIKSIEYGIYAKKMGGGSVNPLTNDFNFAVIEGYIVRNGEICEPVRGASLIGNGAEILNLIDMVGQNLDRGQGMCGSVSGAVPTDVGQPLIRVSNITVGGR
ncbi:MAG: TldD/PmbA family protein [Clostridia bacterium]|nr:TldD/PmbA family protein [Clostridia bacterium]